MENFIFIIFAIIIFAYKQYQKSLKKKSLLTTEKTVESTPRTQNIVAEKVENTLDEFINDFFGEKEIDSDTISELRDENEFVENPIIDEELEHQNMDIIGEEIESIETDNSANLKERYKKQFGINQNKEDKSTEIVDFDLRKAVIYDAVLNPPYIIN
jgi:hypothetical protein